jgi:hypothetical protein
MKRMKFGRRALKLISAIPLRAVRQCLKPIGANREVIPVTFCRGGCGDGSGSPPACSGTKYPPRRWVIISDCPVLPSQGALPA